MRPRTSLVLAAYLALILASEAALADRAGDMMEGYAGYSLLHWMRAHPGGTFVAIVVIVLLLTVAVLVIARRVRREVESYAESTREHWHHARDRLTHFGHRRDGRDRDQRDVS